MQIFTIFFYALAAECPVERFSEIYYNDRRKGMRLMTKDIKMLAIDLDGTLLHDDMSISPFTADILKKPGLKAFVLLLPPGACSVLPGSNFCHCSWETSLWCVILERGLPGLNRSRLSLRMVYLRNWLARYWLLSGTGNGRGRPL